MRSTAARPVRVFLLSPARVAGERTELLLNPGARFDLARDLRSVDGAALGAVFQFTSGLYFRGKLVYARRFARPPRGVPAGLVMTAGRGLVDVDERVRESDLREMGAVEIDARNPRFRVPLERDARALARRLDRVGEVVLLGSIASAKYTSILLEVFGERLRFPEAFVGRGDLSRGGLLLRCAAAGLELDYVPVQGAVLRGPRPPRLPRLAGRLDR